MENVGAIHRLEYVGIGGSVMGNVEHFVSSREFIRFRGSLLLGVR